MYKFQFFLPFLPVEYRRRLSYDLLIGYCQLQDGESDIESLEAKVIFKMFEAIQVYDMRRVELAGKTNTSCNPFETDLTPHH